MYILSVFISCFDVQKTKISENKIEGSKTMTSMDPLLVGYWIVLGGVILILKRL